jgi:hypothetical protein
MAATSKVKPSKPKRNALTLAAVGAFWIAVLTQADWLNVSMQPKGKTVELGTMSGASILPSLSALSMFLLAGTVLLALNRGRIAKVFAAVLATSTITIAYLSLAYAMNPSAADNASQMRTWLQIAQAHDVAELSSSLTANPWLVALASLIALTGQAIAISTAHRWPARSAGRTQSTVEAATAAESDDAISIWDSQRAKSN